MRPFEKLPTGILCPVVAAFAVATHGFDRPAYAQGTDTASTTVQLEFAAPAPCADRNLFVDRVHARSERIQFTSIADKQLTITVDGEDAKWMGEASFMEPSQEPVSRQITARSCDELLDGLALVTVMVLDPEAMQRAPAASAPATPPAPAPTAAMPAPRKPVTVPAAPPFVPWHFAYGFDVLASAISGPAPATMLGYGAMLRADWLKAHHLLSPKFTLGFTHSARDQFRARAGIANFTLDTINLSLCPIAIRFGSWGGRPCIAGSIGVLTAQGTRTFVPVTDHLTWADAGARLEFTWNPASSLEVFIAPALGVALSRYSFAFTPYDFYQVPPVIFSGTAGAGLQFE